MTRAAFEELAAEIVERLRDIVAASAAIDGLWFDIHGAMCVEGLDDVEAELLRRIRRVIGEDVIVSASMDLHGNVSRELAHQTDLITCYRMAPHEDTMKTKERSCRNLVHLLMQKPRRRPIKAWVPIPILLPGEQTSTRVEPAKHIYAAVPQVEAMKGVIDAAIWVGYAWADEPRNREQLLSQGGRRKLWSKGPRSLQSSSGMHIRTLYLLPLMVLSKSVLEALHRRRDVRSGGKITSQHVLVRVAKLCRILAEQVLAVMIINGSAKVRLARGDEAPLRGRLVAEQFMPMGFLGPDAAPVGPAIDAGDKPLYVVRVDAGRNVSRNEMGKDQIYLRVGCHVKFFLHFRVALSPFRAHGAR